MSDTYVINTPIDIVTKLTKFKVSVFDLVLFEKVSLSVLLLDDKEQPKDTRIYHLTGSDYNAWSNDDNYVVQYVQEQLAKEVQ